MFLFSLIITSNDVCIKNNVFPYETDTTVIEFKIQKRMEAFYIFVSSNYVCVQRRQIFEIIIILYNI